MTLQLRGLVRHFGAVQALDELSFEVPPGQVFGFLGPNGSGKSTTMRAILHLVDLDGGEVLWDGRPYGEQWCRRIGYMPEERGLYPKMKVGEQLSYLAQLHGLNRSDADAATSSWLARLGVRERSGDKVEALSLGNQQRVQLAAALAHDPELLVLDEPFSGLDPVGVDDLAAVLREQAEAGRTVVFSSHQLDLVEGLCQSVAIVDHGRLVTSGRVSDLAAAGPERLVVEVGGPDGGTWADAVAGVTVTERSGGRLRLHLNDGVDPQAVLGAAMAAGAVRHFGFEHRRLSEVFREAVRARPPGGGDRR